MGQLKFGQALERLLARTWSDYEIFGGQGLNHAAHCAFIAGEHKVQMNPR